MYQCAGFIQSLDSTLLTSNYQITNAVYRDRNSDIVSKYNYISSDTDQLILSPYEDPQLKNDYIQKKIGDMYAFRNSIYNKNYLSNLIQVAKWKDAGQIKFIPPDFAPCVFPHSELQSYFVNKNQKRWGELVKTLGLNSLQGKKRTIRLPIS